MANSKVTGLGQITDPAGNDLQYIIDGAAADAKMLVGDFNLLPDGVLWNGKLSVTVTNNNITVALKDRNGNNASTSNPITVSVGGTRRRCTAALSVTKIAGSNWFGFGSAPHAGLERDYFAYLGWNTTPATDIVDIAFSPIPFGRLTSDFSSTTSDDRYLAYGNGSAPAAADEWVCIGRFAATLSATPNFNWSVPTFTNSNLIQHPIYRTRRLTWAPAPTGYSTVPTTTSYQYQIDWDLLTAYIREGSNGTSNATTLTMAAPMAAATVTNGSWYGSGSGIDSGSALTTAARVNIVSGGSTLTFLPNASGTSAWTNSGGKRIAVAQITYGL